MTLSSLIVIFFAAYWLSTLVASDELSGPFNILGKLRRRAGVRYDQYNMAYGTNGFAEMLLCPYCNSIWSGLIIVGAFALLAFAGAPATLVLAPLAAGGFIFLVQELKP